MYSRVSMGGGNGRGISVGVGSMSACVHESRSSYRHLLSHLGSELVSGILVASSGDNLLSATVYLSVGLTCNLRETTCFVL